MNYQNLIIEIKNGICTITVNRPDKLNALNRKTIEEIGFAVKNAETDAAVGGVIITGAGPKAFVAGADISEFANYSADQGKELSAHGHRVFDSIERCSKPVIAAVNGFALGGGCELAMSCHLRIAAENAKFGQPEVKLGLIPGYGGTQRLVQLAGKGKALELMMTAEMITAQQALELGLVNYITPADQLIPKCEELLKKIMAQSPAAIAAVIRCVNAYYQENTGGFKTEINEFGTCFNNEDFKEGTSAFMEKRSPVFRKELTSTNQSK